MKKLSDFELHETCNFLSAIKRLINDYSHLENLPKSITKAVEKEDKRYNAEFDKRYNDK